MDKDTQLHAGLHWYVAYTMPRHEKVIASQLLTRGMETYLPLYRAIHSWK